ncbi:MAG: hypothetical protein GY869_22030 [Planctomycetes bacterium]|nr:hypothetical protein [Planctomycetota bacterium]
MAKTVRKNHIMDNLYAIRESLENSAKALIENEIELAHTENAKAQKELRYLIFLLDQATTIL